MKLMVAGIQMVCVEEAAANVEKAVYWLKAAADQGARLACLPELCTTAWFPREMNPDHYELAVSPSHKLFQPIRRIAIEREMVIVVPFFEKAAPGRYHNSAMVIDTDSRILGRYRKNHIPQAPGYQEKYYFAPGDGGFPVFETRYGRIAVQICWDNMFFEGTRILALRGAQLVCAPTATATFAAHAQWETIIAAQALASQIFILRVNRIGSEGDLHFYGRSFCVDPQGQFVLAPVDDREGAFVAELDLARLETVRREWPLWRDRRPEIYGEIAASSAQDRLF